MFPWDCILLIDKDKNRSISFFLGKKSWSPKKQILVVAGQKEVKIDSYPNIFSPNQFPNGDVVKYYLLFVLLNFLLMLNTK